MISEETIKGLDIYKRLIDAGFSIPINDTIVKSFVFIDVMKGGYMFNIQISEIEPIAFLKEELLRAEREILYMIKTKYSF